MSSSTGSTMRRPEAQRAAVITHGRAEVVSEPLERLRAVAQERGVELVLPEEEVPRAGARITRAYQLARWSGGATLLWVGRRKGAGRGEGSSGLRFDQMDASGSG